MGDIEIGSISTADGDMLGEGQGQPGDSSR